jgi:hypothetical protein
MTVFLGAFSFFNLLLSAFAVRRAMRLMTPAGRDWWASERLYAIALFAAWTLPAICMIATGLAWGYAPAARHWAAPTILAPILWLLVMGVFFAVVDVAEDGVLDFGHGPRNRERS